jgi:hypothetical protein
MATDARTLHAKVDVFYSKIQSLKSTSSPEDFDAFGAFFDKDCIAYLKSMREYAEPSIGRQAAMDTLKEILAEYHIEERRVLSRATSEDGSTVIVEMKNRLNVLGDTLDPFYETVVATFNDEGLISELKTYSCRSHIVGMIQDKTGVGPYSK